MITDVVYEETKKEDNFKLNIKPHHKELSLDEISRRIEYAENMRFNGFEYDKSFDITKPDGTVEHHNGYTEETWKKSMRISPNPSELPYIVLGMDGKIHEAFIDCDECVCGMKIKSRKDKDIKHARENGALWCNDECMKYSY